MRTLTDWPMLYYQGRHRLLLAELLAEFAGTLPRDQMLIRASDSRDFARILEFGTDRGGFAQPKMWRFNQEAQTYLRHADVIYATSIAENLEALQDSDASCSLKKLDIIDNPLLLVYDMAQLDRVWDRQFAFREAQSPLLALKAVFRVKKLAPIQGWFSDADGLFYRGLAERFLRGKIVELGSWKGLSSSYLAGCCRRNNNTVYCVDWWKQGSEDEFASDYLAMTSQVDIEEIFSKNMQDMDFPVKKMSMSTRQAAQNFADKSLDMVFLDASHDFHSVQRDLVNWSPKLKAAGILAGHDYKDKHAGLRAAVDDFAKQSKRAVKFGGDSIWYLETER